jgi:hypothetical protein
MTEYNRIGTRTSEDPVAVYADLVDAPYEIRETNPAEVWPVTGNDWPPSNCPDCATRGHQERQVAWAEACYVPGHRICPWCGSHFSLETEDGKWVLRRAVFT